MNAKLVKLIRETFDRKRRGAVITELELLVKKPGVIPLYLQIATSTKYFFGIRYGAVLLFENYVTSAWTIPDKTLDPPVALSAQDRSKIKDTLVTSIVNTQSDIQARLIDCLKYIFEHDFRHAWPSLCLQIGDCLRSPHPSHWPGGLRVVIALVESYAHLEDQAQAALEEELVVIIPLLHFVINQSIIAQTPTATATSPVVVEGIYLVLKLVHKCLSKRISISIFGSKADSWAHFCFVIHAIDNAVLRSYSELEWRREKQGGRGKESQSEFWIVNKWAMRLMGLLLVPKKDDDDSPYRVFCDHYAKTHAKLPLELVIKVLVGHFVTGHFIEDAVLRPAIVLLATAVMNEHTFKFVQPHTTRILTHLIFPLLNLSDADIKLLNTDPVSFVNGRFVHGNNSNLIIPCVEQLYRALLLKNHNPTLRISMSHLSITLSDQATSLPQQKFGAFHALGVMSLWMKNLGDIKEEFVIRSVLSYLTASSSPYLRLGACWVSAFFSKFPFQERMFLHMLLKLITVLDSGNGDPPYVQAAAAIGIQQFLTDHPSLLPIVESKMLKVCFDLVTLVEKTEDCYEIVLVITSVVSNFPDQVVANAPAIYDRLATTLCTIVKTQSIEKCHAIAFGLMETIIGIMKLVVRRRPDLVPKMEKPSVPLVRLVMGKQLKDMYRDVFIVFNTLSNKRVPGKLLWFEFNLLFTIVENGDNDALVHAMPAFYSFISVDPVKFLEDPIRIVRMIQMIEKVIDKNVEEDGKGSMFVLLHGLKLLEVMTLQCGDRNDGFFGAAARIAMELLEKKFRQYPVLDSSCALVVLAVMHMDKEWTFITNNIIPHVINFINSYIFEINHTRDMVHEAKVFILGMCAILERSVEGAGSVYVDPHYTGLILSRIAITFMELEETITEIDEDNPPKPTLASTYPAMLDEDDSLFELHLAIHTSLNTLLNACPLWLDQLMATMTPKEQTWIEEMLKNTPGLNSTSSSYPLEQMAQLAIN